MGCKILPQNNLKIFRKSGACLMRSNHSPMTKHRACKVVVTPPRSAIIAALLLHKSRPFFFLGGSKNAKSNNGHGVTCLNGLQFDPTLRHEHFPGGEPRNSSRKMQGAVQFANCKSFDRGLQHELCLVGWQTKGDGFGRGYKSEQQRHND